MDMLLGDKIAEANLTDWRKLAQGLHARYVVDDFSTGARFIAAVGEAGDEAGHHPSVSMGTGYIDLKLITDDAIYRDDDGTEHVVAWPTQQDVDLARRITEIAASHGLAADPASVSQFELGIDTPNAAVIAPVWAALSDREPIQWRRGPRRHGTGSEFVVRKCRRGRGAASAVPRRGLRGARGGRATDCRRRRRGWDRRR